MIPVGHLLGITGKKKYSKKSLICISCNTLSHTHYQNKGPLKALGTIYTSIPAPIFVVQLEGMLPCVFLARILIWGEKRNSHSLLNNGTNFSDCRIAFIPIQTLEESIECTKCVAGFLVMHFQLTKRARVGIILE
jgi:hypothetical protein